MTSTVCGCSKKRSGIFSSPRRTSSRLISFAAASSGTVGNARWTARMSRVSTVASPMPGVEDPQRRRARVQRPSSFDARAPTTAFSLQVLTNARYFCRLSKNRKGSALGCSSPCASRTPARARRTRRRAALRSGSSRVGSARRASPSRLIQMLGMPSSPGRARCRGTGSARRAPARPGRRPSARGTPPSAGGPACRSRCPRRRSSRRTARRSRARRHRGSRGRVFDSAASFQPRRLRLRQPRRGVGERRPLRQAAPERVALVRGQLHAALRRELGEHGGHHLAVARARPVVLDARLDLVVALEERSVGAARAAARAACRSRSASR